MRPGRPCGVCAESGGDTHFCVGCGNEYVGRECPVCAERTAADTVAQEQRAWQTKAERRTTFCPGCGNDIPADRPCRICADRVPEPAEQQAEVEQFCNICGNVYSGRGDCPVCSAGRAPTRKTEPKMCPGCGNDVEDPLACPICADGRSISARKRKEEDRGPVCPQCNEVLEMQDWDGVPALMCASCQGILFPPGGLEGCLDRLRETAESDLDELVERRREMLLHGSMPKDVRYKPCPVCKLSMTRRNYLGASGIIIEVCGRHGTWVDPSTFGQLTDFVTRGGDEFLAGRRR